MFADPPCPVMKGLCHELLPGLSCWWLISGAEALLFARLRRQLRGLCSKHASYVRCDAAPERLCRSDGPALARGDHRPRTQTERESSATVSRPLRLPRALLQDLLPVRHQVGIAVDAPGLPRTVGCPSRSQPLNLLASPL